MLYLDNAATSYPKPPQVAQRMCEYITEVGATINRSVYGKAQEAGLVTLELRQRLARLLGYGGMFLASLLPLGVSLVWFLASIAPAYMARIAEKQ